MNSLFASILIFHAVLTAILFEINPVHGQILAGNQSSLSGSTSPPFAGSTCEVHADCKASTATQMPMYCLHGQCMPTKPQLVPCQLDYECNSGLTCISGVCNFVQPTGGSGITDQDNGKRLLSDWAIILIVFASLLGCLGGIVLFMWFLRRRRTRNQVTIEAKFMKPSNGPPLRSSTIDILHDIQQKRKLRTAGDRNEYQVRNESSFAIRHQTVAETARALGVQPIIE